MSELRLQNTVYSVYYCRPELSSEEDYEFVEKPSTDYYCPVTKGLLLKPYLTSCCGNHLSHEAVGKINPKENLCPLCKTFVWSTVLNKHFQRQVKSLHVFCRNKGGGCVWQGELSAQEYHIKQSCTTRDTTTDQ